MGDRDAADPEKGENARNAGPGFDNHGFEPSNDDNNHLSRGNPSPASTAAVGTFHPSVLDKNDLIVPKPEAEDTAEGAGERDQWSSQIEFLLSCISMSVGLGNVWRFPFVAYENGGGAFLIPYLIVLTVIGRPIYFLEMVLGQFSSFGSIKVWKMAPLFKGVGYGSMVGTIVVVSYYCSIMAITVFYFFASFQATLPWANCKESWAGDGMCAENATYQNSKGENISLAELYYSKFVFVQKENIDDGIGTPEWRLTLCLLFSWILVFLSLIKGVKSSGKVAYFTALFPYVVLLVLLVRGVTLPGAGKGIEYFLKPDWKELYNPKVWYAATTQCFFSLGTGFGPIIMFSSYNPFRHNVYRDAMIISVTDTFTSLLSGLTTFAILGALAEEVGVEVPDVVKSGAGMTFVSYPEAIAKFPAVPQLFSVLFFLMLFALGVGSATSLTSGVITIICDQWPSWKRWQVTAFICGSGFLVGLMYVCPGGQFMLTLLNYYGADFVIYVTATCEVAGVAWVYGIYNLATDIEFMIGVKIGWYWKICWGLIIPIGLTAILIYAFATSGELEHEGVTYPTIATVFGWCLSAFALLLLPGWALHAIFTRKSTTFLEKLKESIRPTREWGPKSAKVRKEWEDFKINDVEVRCRKKIKNLKTKYGFV